MANIYLLSGIVTVFVLLGFTLPFVNEAFGEVGGAPALSNFEDSLGQKLESTNTVTVTKVIFSLLTIWFWTFGALPLWFELCILLPLRIILAYIFVDLIWIGGGG
jgi:hypothetical protein